MAIIRPTAHRGRRLLVNDETWTDYDGGHSWPLAYDWWETGEPVTRAEEFVSSAYYAPDPAMFCTTHFWQVGRVGEYGEYDPAACYVTGVEFDYNTAYPSPLRFELAVSLLKPGRLEPGYGRPTVAHEEGSSYGADGNWGISLFSQLRYKDTAHTYATVSVDLSEDPPLATDVVTSVIGYAAPYPSQSAFYLYDIRLIIVSTIPPGGGGVPRGFSNVVI